MKRIALYLLPGTMPLVAAFKGEALIEGVTIVIAEDHIIWEVAWSKR